MNYEIRMKNIDTLINNYKNTKAEEDFNKLLHSLNSYINNTLMRVYGNIDEDVKSDTLMNITKWINNRDENVGKYVVNQIIYFIRHYKFNSSYTGLTRNEKHEFRKLYLAQDKSESDVKRYTDLKSKIIHLDLGIDYETVQHKNCVFESVKDLLTEDEYKIVYSYFKENYTLEEIGIMLNVSKQAINKRLEKILKKLKDELVIE
jgi:RNA polymerase sigma factor (sigma-70 family)